jgi:acetyl-CoA carboxylase biotin carboxylase subunit
VGARTASSGTQGNEEAGRPAPAAMIRRVLVANRGEIALRVIRACRALGIESVAVYSQADEDAPHVRAADRALSVGPAPSSASYLNIPRIIDAARMADADALHPGYGFLSENPLLAEACEAGGITFVGPPAAVMRRMGSKTGARAVAADAGVPVVPGRVPASQDDAELAAAASEVGYPILLKAAAGGGGRGMRIVRTAAEFEAALTSARQEALRAFGRDTLYVERLIEHARHIEVQVFGDRHGSVVHLFERDCTLQRRHQKVIEEAPASSVSPLVRGRLAAAAVALARSLRYEGAGTVEFLVEGSGDDGAFYFLEMNMRLQVEHPITEAITGIDLVQLQLAVASGERLPLTQADVRMSGHAIECRVYAEDARTLLPQSGRLLRYREPSGPGLRVDGGVVEGQAVTVHYDALLAKVIAHGATRDEARARILEALRGFEILGVRHNVSFLLALLEHPDVIAGAIDTRFIERHLDELTVEPSEGVRRAAIAMAAMAATGNDPREAADLTPPASDPWDAVGPRRF